MTSSATSSTTSTSAEVGPRDMANAIRALSMDAVQAANSGHPGMPMGMADVATVLFTEFLKFDAADPDWADRDRFVLSAGHGSMLLYSLLYLTGYQDMTIEEIRNFRQMGAKTAGHPEYGHARGIETTTGPLGQGIGNAVGMAMAERSMAARFGDAAVDHMTYAIAGDGCLMEGISHEAISLAGHLKLGKLIVLFDDNQISIDGPVDLSCSDDQIARFKAAGWDTQAIDGHDPDAIRKAIKKAQDTATPSLIACRTIIGFGAPTKQGTSATHGAPLGDEEIAGAREKLGWPYPPFEVPEAVLDAWRAAGARGGMVNEAWRERIAGMDADTRGEMQRVVAGALDVPGLEAAVAGLKRQTADEQPKIATRQCSGNTLDALTQVLPEMIGGSADLTGSNNTKAKGQVPLTANDFSGTYVYYGVREHGMAAAMNGMALHGGVIPYGATFLVFTDYCRPSIRLSALMGIRVIYVMTHDSIGLGEDGPTHQPVEHLAALRAMPNLNVFRPADLAETAEAWELALKAEKTPSVIVLSRQGLPTMRTDYTDENLSAKGAYVLAEASGGSGARKATLIGTGSELHLALEARETLEAEGIPAAVVSMTEMDLFARQSDEYQNSVLGVGTGKGTVRVAIEAAVAQGWDRWVGPEGAVIGMTSFGGSAPAGELYKHFGITADAAVAAVKSRI